MNYTYKITPTKIFPERTYFTIEIPPVITEVNEVRVPKCHYIVKDELMTSTSMKTLEISLRPYV